MGSNLKFWYFLRESFQPLDDCGPEEIVKQAIANSTTLSLLNISNSWHLNQRDTLTTVSCLRISRSWHLNHRDTSTTVSCLRISRSWHLNQRDTSTTVFLLDMSNSRNLNHRDTSHEDGHLNQRDTRHEDELGLDDKWTIWVYDITQNIFF